MNNLKEPWSEKDKSGVSRKGRSRLAVKLHIQGLYDMQFWHVDANAKNQQDETDKDSILQPQGQVQLGSCKCWQHHIYFLQTHMGKCTFFRISQICSTVLTWIECSETWQSFWIFWQVSYFLFWFFFFFFLRRKRSWGKWLLVMSDNRN